MLVGKCLLKKGYCKKANTEWTEVKATTKLQDSMTKKTKSSLD